MDDLIEYINGGNCILFLGAGVSRSAGLPDWPVLVGLIAEEFKSKLDKQKIETFMSSRNFPHLFGEVSRTCGEKELVDSCIKHLRWSAARPVSRLYSLLLNWGFQAFFTTNFDDLIRLALNQRGIAASVHTNSRKDLAAVDIDSVLSIVKLHGELFPIQAGLTDDQKLILTDDQYLQAEAGAFVKEQAALREMEKSEARAGTEAEAFAIISNWDLMRPPNVSETGWRASLLSQGGFLNRIARDGPRPLQYNVVMRADVVYEFLVRLGRREESFTSFKDVMLSSYFNTSAHFIDTEKYRRFFGTLIAEAEQIYKRDYLDFQKYLNSNFTTDYLDEFDAMDKPLVVKAFEDQLRQKLEGLTHELAVERKAKGDVEKELERYKEEERKRLKHIEKSKKRMARMAEIGKPGKRSARFGKKGKTKRH